MVHHLLSDCSSPLLLTPFISIPIIGRIIHGDRTRKILQEQQNKYWSGYFGNKAAWPDFTNNNPPAGQGGFQGPPSTFTPQYPQWPPWPWTPKVTPPMSFPPSPAPAPSKPLPQPAHDGNPSHSIALPPQLAGTGSRPVVAGVVPGVGHSGHVSRPAYVIAAAGASLLAAVSVALFVLCYRSSKVVTVRPWATGLSGQLQKAFVTGGPLHPRHHLKLLTTGPTFTGRAHSASWRCLTDVSTCRCAIAEEIGA